VANGPNIFQMLLVKRIRPEVIRGNQTCFFLFFRFMLRCSNFLFLIYVILDFLFVLAYIHCIFSVVVTVGFRFVFLVLAKILAGKNVSKIICYWAHSMGP